MSGTAREKVFNLSASRTSRLGNITGAEFMLTGYYVTFQATDVMHRGVTNDFLQ